MDKIIETPFDFTLFAFPNTKHPMELICPKIATLKEMGLTEEQLIRGRKVKPYPEKFDDFNSVDDLKEYVRLQINSDVELEWTWLTTTLISYMRLQQSKEVYYTPVTSIAIQCFDPYLTHNSIRKGKKLLQMNPLKQSFVEIESIIEQLKTENSNDVKI